MWILGLKGLILIIFFEVVVSLSLKNPFKGEDIYLFIYILFS